MTKLERELEASLANRQLAVVPQHRHDIELAAERTAWTIMREQAKTLVESGFLPKAIRTPEQAMAIIQTGKELGLQPMQSIRSIHIIEGRPCMSADLIAGLALSRHPGGTLRVVETTNERCLVVAARAGNEPTEIEFTIQDARNAGLAGKDVWRKYPRAMLRARCLTEAARCIFPDIVAGLYDPEELDGPAPLPVGSWEEVPADRRLAGGHVSPHGHDSDLSEQELAELVDPQELMAMLTEAESLLSAGHWSKARSVIGSKGGHQGEFGGPFSAAKNAGKLSADYSKALGKLWGNLDRRIAKLEAEDLAKPADVLSTMTDDPEDFPRE